jgi:hypothetical protein
LQIDVTLRPVADLAPYSRNARKHSTAAVARLVAIIEDMGWTNPILVDEDGIVAGHKRRLAALSIYEKGGTIRLPGGRKLPAGMVPVLDVSGWTEAQRRTYILADNQTTLESEWDGEILRLELSWLEGAGVDMGLTGFDAAALSAALGFTKDGKDLGDPDAIPEADESKPAVTSPGDVWLLGAYFECEACGKQFSYEEGQKLGGECDCDKE